jgi:hypothetical protein
VPTATGEHAAVIRPTPGPAAVRRRRASRRALDRPVLVELVEPTLSHGASAGPEAIGAAEALVVLGHWAPRVVLLVRELDEIDAALRLGPAAHQCEGAGPGSLRLPNLRAAEAPPAAR